MKPKYRKLPKEQYVLKPAAMYGKIVEFGRSSIVVTCPFCGTDTRGYIWSLSGGGKRCPKCNALLGYGNALKDTEEIK